MKKYLALILILFFPAFANAGDGVGKVGRIMIFTDDIVMFGLV